MSAVYSSSLQALSFSSQPSLRELFHVVVETNDPVTLVCGAGVSSDAGLPNWNQLIDNMCGMVPKELQGHLRADSSDVMRRVDYILRLIQGPPGDRRQSVGDIVRRALYPDYTHEDQVLPGHLANAIAQLTSALNGRVRIITTNFDDVLEAALEGYYAVDNVRTLDLTQVTEWNDLAGSSSEVRVLHVHGAVGLSPERTKGEVILSQARFQRSGADVQKRIEWALENSHTIFVGLSMTDPNLVGPLSRVHSSFSSFMLFVPDHLTANRMLNPKDRRTGDAYTGKRNEFFEEDLNLKLVILKSYSQVQQVIFDLGLANSAPHLYFSDDRKISIRYGFRIKRALDYTYEAIDLNKKEELPTQAKARAISDYLEEVLSGEGGPKRLLQRFAGKLEKSAVLPDLGLSSSYLGSEGFALFLWLRGRKRLHNEGHYCLRLIGTSAYSHRYPWSAHVSTEVCNSDWPPAVVAFKGRVSIESLIEQRRGGGIWKSTVMVPIRWTNQKNERDSLLVGVLALNSTRQIAVKQTLFEAAEDRKDVKRQVEPSILGLLDLDERRELQVCLTTCFQRLINRHAPLS